MQRSKKKRLMHDVAWLAHLRKNDPKTYELAMTYAAKHDPRAFKEARRGTDA